MMRESKNPSEHRGKMATCPGTAYRAAVQYIGMGSVDNTQNIGSNDVYSYPSHATVAWASTGGRAPAPSRRLRRLLSRVHVRSVTALRREKRAKSRTSETMVLWAWAVRPDQAKRWRLLETPVRHINTRTTRPPCIIHAPRSTRQPTSHQRPAAGTARLLIEVVSRSFASYSRCQAHSPRAASCKHVSASLSMA